jgi:hypothetical protein
MKKSHQYKWAFIFFVLLTGGSYRSYANIDERFAPQPLTGTQLAVNSEITAIDTVYYNTSLRPQQTIYNTLNVLTFGIDEYTTAQLPDSFKVTIDLYIEKTYLNQFNAELTATETRSFTIEWYRNRDANQLHKRVIKIYNGNGIRNVRVMARITGFAVLFGNATVVKNILQLTNEMTVNRQYQFNCSTNAVKSFDMHALTSGGELQVSWGKERAAEEYDLEWAYIDSSALANYYQDNTTVYDPNKIFTGNSTRVSITSELYKIPLLYDNTGVLFYRVRVVQVKYGGQRSESDWSTNYSVGLGQYLFTGHERALNWQATTSFAEEGKRKSVVQYFDGSLRGRQTVTKGNSTDTTIVAETFYDYQGRATIQVLPAPGLNSMIGFTPNFTTNSINGAEYDKNRYDGIRSALPDYCGGAADSMNTNSGASRYYSPNNALKNTGYNRYIPDAKGFPFTETRYTPDNTGRISKQSGVGPDFKIGSNHETVYYYGTADQEELDALFGTEAGAASHYFKNMVLDANGQYSVSYVDMHGRTVATALAGEKPLYLDSLKSKNTRVITKKLLDASNNQVKGTSIEATKTLLVPRAGSHRFIYSLLPDSVSIKSCTDTIICYDCMYDLEITISDDCGNVQFGGTPKVFRRNNVQLPRPDSLCNTNVNFPGIDDTLTLSAGSYVISKKLSMSLPAMEYYRDSIFTRRNTCKTVEDFIEEQRVLLRNQLKCNQTCAECTTDLGTWDQFRNNYLQAAGIPASDSANFRGEALAAYQEQLNQCNDLCGTNISSRDLRASLLADVTPPGGQYADPEASNPFSVFLNNRYKPFQYLDANGKESIVIITDAANNDIEKKAGELSKEEFSANFRDSWANTLLPLHPEYQHLLKYEQLEASHSWDERFSKIDSYQQAKDSGFLNPLHFTGVIVASRFPLVSGKKDAYFQSATNPYYNSGGIADETTMAAYLNNALAGPGYTTPPVSLWRLATAMAHCKQINNGTGTSTCYQQYSVDDNLLFREDSLCTAELDMAWRFFREAYQNKKKELVFARINTLSGGNPVAGNTPPFFRHFGDKTVIDELGWGTGKQNDANATDSLNAYVDTACRGYAQQWWDQLRPCNFSAADSAIVVNKLMQVCKEGGDMNHVYGSSTVRPASTAVLRSFDAVVKDYCLATGKVYGDNCNGYLITAPAPYDPTPVYGELPVWQTPDSCQCTQISRYYTEYQANKIVADNSFAAYLLRTTGTSIRSTALDSLRLMCNGTIKCNYLPQPVSLPAILQCGVKDVCVDCIGIDTIYTAYRLKFPAAIPVYDETDSVQIKKNRLFENYMNQRLGFSKTTQEYIQFMDSCGFNKTPCMDMQLVVDSFNRTYYAPLNCTTNKWSINFPFSFTPVVPLCNAIDNKTLHIPASYAGNHNIAFDYRNNDLCLGNEFSVEYRIKRPVTARDPGTATVTVGAIYVESQKNIAIGFTGTTAWWNGYGLPTTSVSFNSNFTDWRTVRITKTATGYNVYYDSAFVMIVPKIDTVTAVPRISVLSSIDTYLDWVKVYDKNSNQVFFEDFTDTSNFAKPIASAICSNSANNCVTAFTNYYNQKKGTSLTYDQIAMQYKQNCGKTLNICTNPQTADSSLLKKYADEFYTTQINPYNRTVYLSMRTFAGNKTILDGPKGVFNVNKKLIGNTVDGTPTQINTSYANIWNSDSVNSKIGILSALADGRFKLELKPGQQAPCNGIIGQRFYQIDVRANGLLRWICFGSGSYVDFGDGYQAFFEPVFSEGIVNFDGKTQYGEEDGWYGFGESYQRIPELTPRKRHYTSHIYPVTSDGSFNMYTVTVYHTDVKGQVFFSDVTPASQPSSFYNFRGYIPQETFDFWFYSTKDSTINTTKNIKNFKQITSIESLQFGNMQNITSPFLYNNFESFENNKNLLVLRFMPAYQFASYTDSVSFNQKAGKRFYQNAPSIDKNFPKLRLIQLIDWTRRESDLDSFNMSLPRLRYLGLGWNTLKSYQLDTVIKQIARVNPELNGQIQYGYGVTPDPLTSQSQNAVNQLTSQGWTIQNIQSASWPTYGLSVSTPKDTSKMLSTTEFSEFINQKLGSNYRASQIDSIYYTKTGSVPNFCSYVYIKPGGPILCGRTTPIFTKVAVPQVTPCADSSLFAVMKGTMRYEAYRDSVLNSFQDRYAQKCLAAASRESFTVNMPISEYHYTLYYYDQAGNLVKTIPPEGVDISKFGWTTAWSDSVKTAKAANTLRTPAHWLPTQYAYNSLNQVVQQKSPDGGRTAFWYDRLGRLALSQNARQRGVTASTTSDSLKLYSYTRYDILGRITEVGQIKNTTSAFMTETISRNEPTLNSWFSARSNRRGQITNTVYDIGDITLNSQLTAANLRNRVAYTTYTDSTNLLGYSQATYYSYDIHGNVDTLLQDYGNSSYVPNVMNRNANNRWKKIVYGYDLISGKVNWVAYNPKKIDEFFHRYYYDAENRLTTVETSADSLVWERDARYEYYKHGPMARSVIGQQLVQGMDYAYTLQGWLKGVNSAGGSPLGGGGDMGEDGKSNGQNKYIARDAFGYHLNYFTGDYKGINGNYDPFPGHSGLMPVNGIVSEYRPLYNGNISSMMVNIAALNEPVLHNYRYDQLNRLTGMDTYTGFSYLNNNWGSTTLLPLRKDANGPDGAYKERITYDGNGNIKTYFRKGRWGDTPMDSLTYNYTYNAQGQLQDNKLNFVRDRVNNTNTYAQASRDDLEDQSSGNYGYDEIGNLIKDTKESITSIKWSVYGKILEINRTATAENTATNTSANDVVKINYSYDASGNRISKRVQKSTGRTFYTWYARDAQGNVMATYTVDTASTTVTPSTNLQNYDVHLYGSSRLGTLYRGIGATTNYTPPENLFFERGNKQYELTNHLGNVLATISDKKKGYDTTGDGQVDYFLADTRQATDYHPFGWGMIGRNATYNLFGYKYSMNGQEKSTEIEPGGSSTTAEFWQYDSRTGKRWNVDPVIKSHESPYMTFAGNPILLNDPKGDEPPKKASGWKRFWRNFITHESHKTEAEDYAIANKIDEKNILDIGNQSLVVINDNNPGDVRYSVFRRSRVDYYSNSANSSNDLNLNTKQFLETEYVQGQDVIDVALPGGAPVKGFAVMGSKGSSAFVGIVAKTEKTLEAYKKAIRFGVSGHPDVLNKGFHLHFDEIVKHLELALKPTNKGVGLIQVGKVSVGTAYQVQEAVNLFNAAMGGQRFRAELLVRLKVTQEYLQNAFKSTIHAQQAIDKAHEINYIIKGIQKIK